MSRHIGVSNFNISRLDPASCTGHMTRAKQESIPQTANSLAEQKGAGPRIRAPFFLSEIWIAVPSKDWKRKAQYVVCIEALRHKMRT